MVRGRAYRRWRMKLAKEKARRRANRWASSRIVPPTEKEIGRLARTPAMCSCPMCGNPRRHFNEVTRQERIAEIREQEQLRR